MPRPLVVIDVETSGLFRYDQPADAPGQPRLAALAMVRLGPDLTVVDSEVLYVRPDGWEMPPEVEAIHGLSTAFLQANGRPIDEVLDAYVMLIRGGYGIAAFGADFDLKMMRGELRRAGRPDFFAETPKLCIMKACSGYVVKANGKRGWPKLVEACAHFKIPQGQRHDALADAADAAAVLRRVVQLGASAVALTPGETEGATQAVVNSFREQPVAPAQPAAAPISRPRAVQAPAPAAPVPLAQQEIPE